MRSRQKECSVERSTRRKPSWSESAVLTTTSVSESSFSAAKAGGVIQNKSTSARSMQLVFLANSNMFCVKEIRPHDTRIMVSYGSQSQWISLTVK